MTLAIFGLALTDSDTVQAIQESGDAEAWTEIRKEEKWAKELCLDDLEMDAYRLFQALFTQWAFTMGVRTGIVYSEVPGVAAMLGIEVTEPLFGCIRAMEATALSELGKRSPSRSRKK